MRALFNTETVSEICSAELRKQDGNLAFSFAAFKQETC